VIMKERTMTKSRTKTLTVAAAISCALIATAHAAMTISNTRTKHVTCTGGVCTPTRSNANLNVGDLQTMLASSDVSVKSNAAAPDIGILDSLTWASTHRLTLDAYHSIHVRAPVAVEGTAGVTLTTSDGASGGDYTFNTATSGAITFWDTASSLVINGESYTLVNDIKTLVSDLTSNPGPYALARSYDASADGSYTNSPIESFGGTLEGLGNQILNLTVQVSQGRHSYAGLVSVLSGTVRDIGLANANISTTFGLAGVIAAYSPSGTIIHASASGTVTAGGKDSSAGGLVGEDLGPITDSSAGVTVEAAHAGGLVGRNEGYISLCRATGSVSASTNAGGLVGWNLARGISQSYAAGSATAIQEGASAGGLVGMNQSNAWIRESYATGPATGNVPNTQAGGLVGVNKLKGNIQRTYSTGFVSVVSGPAGGLIGVDRVGVDIAYWDLDTSGITNPDQGAGDPLNDDIIGLTDAQLKSGLPANFEPDIWGQNPGINNGWPYLLANPPQ